MKLRNRGLVTGLMFVFCVVALAAGIDGKWTGQVEGPQGTMDITFVFKAEGEKLTGTYSNTFGEAKIDEGTIKGDAVSFKVVRELNGNKFTLAFNGKLSGDELKLTRTFVGEAPGGNAPPATEITVKRAK